MRRWLRRLAAFVVGLLIVITAASLVFNWLSARPRTLAARAGRDVQVGSVRVHYEQWGDHGSPVVLVPGFAESTVAWSTMAPILARDHVVYAVDPTGFGYTDYTGRYTLPDQVALVSGFLAALHLDHPVLVGHSMGAAIVGGVALSDPAAIRGIVFADGDALPFDRGGGPPGWVFRLPYVTSAYRLLTTWDWPASAIIRAQCGSGCPPLGSALVDAWIRPFRQGAAESALPVMAAGGVLHLDPAQIRAIAVPRGIIWGAEDSSSGGSLAAARADLGDPPTLIIPRAAHLSMLAAPAAFAADLEQLISGFARPSAHHG